MGHISHKQIQCLTQCLNDGRVRESNTIFFINDNVPKDRAKDITYGSFSCDLKSRNKTKISHQTYRRWRQSKLPKQRRHTNSRHDPFQDPDKQRNLNEKSKIWVDIKDFYLCTPMKRFEYMRLKLTNLPEKNIREYGLQALVTPDEYVYSEI
jgi:hypothetical protein